jgi:transposase
MPVSRNRSVCTLLSSQLAGLKMMSAMKIADTNSETPFRVRVNRSGRRTFSREYKLEIIEECSTRGVSVAAVALAHRINANQVRKWIVQHRAGRRCPNTAAPALLPVTVEGTGRATLLARAEAGVDRLPRGAAGLIEIELESSRVRIRGSVDAQALRLVLDAFAKR